jgi:hypothetical protein
MEISHNKISSIWREENLRAHNIHLDILIN